MKSYEDMENLLRMYLRKYFSTTAEGWEQRADTLRYVMEIPQNEFEKIWMEEYEEIESYNRMVESMQQSRKSSMGQTNTQRRDKR